MIRFEKMDCWMFQLKKNIPKKVLKELNGWSFDPKFKELWIDADKIPEEDVKLAYKVLDEYNIEYDDVKLYGYGRIYIIENDDSLGKSYDDMEVDLSTELVEEDYYYDSDNDYFLVRFNPDPDYIWVYGYAEELEKEYKRLLKKREEDERWQREWEKRDAERRRLEEERVEKAIREYKEKRQKRLNYLKTLEQVPISFNSVIVRGPKLRCQEEHKVKDMAGKVCLMNGRGEVFEDLVPIKYCFDEDAYFMLDVDYKELKDRGNIMCRIITYREYDYNGLGTYTYDQLAPESKLRMMGYTVAQNEGLSQEVRLNILTGAIAYRIMTKDEIVSHLRWCYRQHRNVHPIAAQKYLDDIEYLQYLDIEKKEVIDIDELVIR